MAIIEKIHISKFRNLSDQYFLPSSSINVIIGNNGHGKTNFIESLYYLGHGRSFKTRNLKEIIPFNHQQIQISAIIDDKKIKINKSREKNTVIIDDKNITSNSNLSQLLPIQIISPDRGFVVGGNPKLKRSYLDWGVYHNNQKTIETYSAYKKTLKNINALLNSSNQSQLEGWLNQFSKLSVEITKERFLYLENLSLTLEQGISSSFSGLVEPFFDFVFTLQTGWPKEVDALDEKSTSEYLVKNKNTIVKTKHLKNGPHRASIDFYFNKQSDSYLSRGEQKKASIVFWMLQVLLLVEKEKIPVVLIDDNSSELDDIKIKSILDFLIETNTQIFMTDIGNKKLPLNDKIANRFLIENGVITSL